MLCVQLCVCCSLFKVVPECDLAGPTSYFWYRQALDVSPGLEHSDGIKWKMLLSLLFSWLIVYICIYKGIKSSGKVGSSTKACFWQENVIFVTVLNSLLDILINLSLDISLETGRVWQRDSY